MFEYRKTLYNRYYSNHVGSTDPAARRVLFDQQKRYLSKEILPLLTQSKTARILDIGCGNGTLVSALHDAGFTETQGIDLSQEQVEVGESFGVKNLTCIAAEEFLESSEDRFDAIFAIDVLEHLSKDEAVQFLRRILSKLTPSGQCIMRVPNMDAPQSSVFAHADLTHELFLNKSSALQIFKSVGFPDVQIHPSLIFIENPIKELLRKILYACLLFRMKLELFATGRTWDKVVFTPNLIIIGRK